MIKQSKQNSIAPQGGMVLVTSLLLLIVVTLLAVGLFRSYGLDERIAGNMREKHRAVNAAETAEQYAEYWLSHGNSSAGITCAAGFVSLAQVCTNALTNVTQIPWTAGVTYIPTVTSAMSVTGVLGGQNSYYQAPAFYITFLGASPTGTGSLFQIDAVGYGGSMDTAAVVEATYLVSSSVKDLGAL
jgi:type IV pilus assembly protein PilX